MVLKRYCAGEVQSSAGVPDEEGYDNIDNVNELPSFNDTSVQELLDRDLSTIGLDPAESRTFVDGNAECWIAASLVCCHKTAHANHAVLLVMEWQCTEVNCWLRHLGNPFAAYADTFEAEQIRGRLIPHMGESALLRLGVSHRDVPRLMEALQR